MQNKLCSWFKLCGVLIICSVQTNLYAADKAADKNVVSYPVAGATPGQRPLGAPVLKETKKGDAWYQNALKGIEYPQTEGGVRLFSLLLQQGNWYNPFTHPGMLGVYDIRRMHQQPIATVKTKVAKEVSVTGSEMGN